MVSRPGYQGLGLGLETKGPRSWSWSRVITMKVSNLVSTLGYSWSYFTEAGLLAFIEFHSLYNLLIEVLVQVPGVVVILLLFLK